MIAISNVILAALLCWIIWKEGKKFSLTTNILCIILGTIVVTLQTIHIFMK